MNIYCIRKSTIAYLCDRRCNEKYLQHFSNMNENGVISTPSLWYYAFHGKDEEIFHIFEESQVNLPKNGSI